MNIFEQYLEKIIDIIQRLNRDHMIVLSEQDNDQEKLHKLIKKRADECKDCN